MKAFVDCINVVGSMKKKILPRSVENVMATLRKIRCSNVETT